jgi:hypothetical protein
VKAPSAVWSVWTQALDLLTVGLDFTDAEDRSVFRIAVAAHCRLVRVRLLVEMARDLGEDPEFARDSAVRAIANGWMAGRRP